MQPHRVRRWTGHNGAASKIAEIVRRCRPSARDATPGKPGAGSSCRSRDHRRITARRRPRPLGVAGDRSRVDPGAARPFRPLGQRGDGQHDQRSADVQADEPLQALHAEIRKRIVFAESVAAGRLARELVPDSTATREVSSLVDELLSWSP